MNLFTLIPLQIIKISKTVKLFCIFLLIASTSQNAQAFELNTDMTNTNNISADQSINWSYLNLANGTLIQKIPSLLDFKARDAAYFVKVIKNQYLTFYSNKNKKLKATYDSGAYFIKYTHRW